MNPNLRMWLLAALAFAVGYFIVEQAIRFWRNRGTIDPLAEEMHSLLGLGPKADREEAKRAFRVTLMEHVRHYNDPLSELDLNRLDERICRLTDAYHYFRAGRGR